MLPFPRQNFLPQHLEGFWLPVTAPCSLTQLAPYPTHSLQDLSAIQSAADKPDFLTSMSMEDDAVIVINAEGTIMMCSQAVNSVFGYGGSPGHPHTAAQWQQFVLSCVVWRYGMALRHGVPHAPISHRSGFPTPFMLQPRTSWRA